MTKNKLIERLQFIDGNPVVLLSDAESEYAEIEDVKLDKMHKSVNEPGEYVTNLAFEEGNKDNTFYRDNYAIEIEKCILLRPYV